MKPRNRKKVNNRRSMKKRIDSMVMLAAVVTMMGSCGNKNSQQPVEEGRNSARMVVNQSALLGDWVMPNPLDGSSEMGIRIKEGGIAESIDQPSLSYRSWKLYNGKLEIVAIREGGGDEVETNLYDILSIGPDTLVIKDTEDTFEYSRYKPEDRKNIIQLEEASEDDYRM